MSSASHKPNLAGASVANDHVSEVSARFVPREADDILPPTWKGGRRRV